MFQAQTCLEGHSVTSFHGRVTWGERCQCGLGAVGTLVSSLGGENEVRSPPWPFTPLSPPISAPPWNYSAPSGQRLSPLRTSLPRALVVTGETKMWVSELDVGLSSGSVKSPWARDSTPLCPFPRLYTGLCDSPSCSLLHNQMR